MTSLEHDWHYDFDAMVHFLKISSPFLIILRFFSSSWLPNRLRGQLPSGKNAVTRHATPATILLAAKGRRRPKRSMVSKIKRAPGSSTTPEMKKSI